jgi:hypothetical protein
MVPEESLTLRRTFGLGGVAFLLFVLLAVTGLPDDAGAALASRRNTLR